MGKITRRPGSPFFYARFFENGKDVWRSTKKTTRREAQLVADAYTAAARGHATADDQFAVLVKILAALPEKEQNSKRVEYAGRLMGNRSNTLTIADAWQSWLDTPLKGTPAAVTIRGYCSIWNRFGRWITTRNAIYLHDVTNIHAQDYAADLWRSKLAPATYNKAVVFLRSVFDTLKDKGGLIANPWTGIKTLEKQTQGRQIFTPAELSIICTKAEGAFHYMIPLGLFTGMRLGDVVNLKWENIGHAAIEIMPLKTRRKNKKIEIPIHQSLRPVLDDLKQKTGEQEYLFPDEQRAYQKDRGQIAKRFQRFLNACGIETQAPAGAYRRNNVTTKGFHSLRHSFVSLCAANRVPQATIQQLVGHGSPAMTERYTHTDAEQNAKAIAALPAMKFNENNVKG